MLDIELVAKMFDKFKHLDSAVFVEVPKGEIADPSTYRFWLEAIEIKWMREFNQGNEHYSPSLRFNEEGGIGGFFGGVKISHSKLYRFDGTLKAYSEDDYRAKRGLLIRDHYGREDVVKVQIIADNLVDFLKKEGIGHKREDFKKSF